MSVRQDAAGFHFDQCPLRETALILRRLARVLTNAVLQGTERPSLTALLTNADVRSLKGEIFPVSRFRAMRTPGRFRAQPQKAWQATARRLAHKKPRKKRPKKRIADGLALSLGAGPGEILPNVFLPTAAALAWDQAVFMREVASAMDTYLRHHPPLAPGSPPVVCFSHQTYWLLISLAADEEPLAFHRGDHRARLLTSIRLRDCAVVSLPPTPWAGFWDQWLLRRALQVWPEAAQALPKALTIMLATMPLLSQQIRAKPQKRVTRKNWGQRVGRGLLPAWQRLWRVPAPPREQVEHPVWALPDWQSEVPSWLAPEYLGKALPADHVEQVEQEHV